jgi:hypothetical protein
MSKYSITGFIILSYNINIMEEQPQPHIKKNDLPDIKQVFINLKIISNIREYDKLITISDEKHIEIDNPGYWQFMRRWWNGRSRQNTISFLKDIIYADAFKIIDMTLENEMREKSVENFFHESNHTILQKFLHELKNSMKGLQNLKITYNYDVSFKSQLDVIIEEIEFRNEKIKETLKISLFQPTPLRNGKIRSDFQ